MGRSTSGRTTCSNSWRSLEPMPASRRRYARRPPLSRRTFVRVNGSTPDLAFVNGAVHTMDAASSRAQAVSVQGGRIVAVGTEDDIRPRLGPGTEVVDLRGRMLVPGFQDAHVHPVSSGVEMLQCDLHDLHDVDGYVKAIASYAGAHPDREWILGGGWSMDVFAGGTPSKSLLDAVVPDRAVFLPNRDGHGAWVNSRALALAGITSDTPDPGDGRIERDPTGSPPARCTRAPSGWSSDSRPSPRRRTCTPA